MPTTAALSPAMLAVLRALAAGTQVDGRSWRAVDALTRRGLVTWDRFSYTVTALGISALAEAGD